MNYDTIQHLIPSLERYRDHGVPTGSFLRACLCNQLAQAFMYANGNNVQLIGKIAMYLWWEMPEHAWGSAEKVKNHINSFKNEKGKKEEGQ